MSLVGYGVAAAAAGFPRVSGDEPFSHVWLTLRWGFPRVSGDEPPVSLIFRALMPFSPRERG